MPGVRLRTQVKASSPAPRNAAPAVASAIPRGRGSVQSVDRAFAVLDAMGRSPQPLQVRELSKQLGLPRPTVYRLLQTLTAQEAVVETQGRYAIGPKLLWLAAQRLGQIELRTAGRPVLLELRDQTGETVHLAVLEHGRVVYIDKLESPGPLRMASTVGVIMPAHSTSLGKAMLAYLRPERVREVLRTHGMERRTPGTITNPKAFFEELEAVRIRGYAIDNIENEEGIRCVGAPIFDHGGEVAGAVSLSGAASSLTLERIRKHLGPQVRMAAQRISQALGWKAPSVEGK